jgi:predicted SnoaL-like aldol condensation-catalyzing enzyme
MPIRHLLLATLAAIATFAASPADARPRPARCALTPRQVVTRFVQEFYVDRHVRASFEHWVDPGYIQHNPFAATGREAAITFLEGYVAANPDRRTRIHRIIADGNLVAVHSNGWITDSEPGVAVVDIFRVRGCRVMEHWDVVQPVPKTSANANGMF